MNIKSHNTKIGLFGIGLNTYWKQFEGLKERLEEYLQVVARGIEESGVRLINAGLVDSVEKAFEAGDDFKREDVDLIFLYVSTYALSATVLPVLKKANVPVIVLNLSPAARIDYKLFNNLDNRTQMTGEWLAFCAACPVPEIANVLKRSNIPFFQITGMLHDDRDIWNEIEEWINAAKVARVLYYNRLGLMGNYYSGMMDIYTDLTALTATFGGHIAIIEVDELSALKESVTDDELSNKIAVIHEIFEVQIDCSETEIRRAAITAVALDKIVDQYQLSSFACYHKGSGNAVNEDTMSSVILGNSLLTGRNVPVAGEYDVKNAIAMKIMDEFGSGGSFTEYYAMDYIDDVVLMGHDGPCHPAIAEGKIKVKPLQVYHGKVGSGLSVEMSVKYGDITLLSIIEDGRGRMKLLIAEGQSVPGEILEIGNTNSRYQFSVGAKGFVEQWNEHGPAHHCAVGSGHIGSSLKKLASILKIDCIQIC